MAFDSKKLVISYSDGEGSTAGVGIAIWSEGDETEAGYIRTPAAIRRLWSRQKEIGGEHHDILEIEALGPVGAGYVARAPQGRALDPLYR